MIASTTSTPASNPAFVTILFNLSMIDLLCVAVIPTIAQEITNVKVTEVLF